MMKNFSYYPKSAFKALASFHGSYNEWQEAGKVRLSLPCLLFQL